MPDGAAGGGIAFGAGAVVQGERGRFTGGPDLTPQQSAFVAAFVSNGGNATAAAEAAGYAEPRVAGWKVHRTPAVHAAIRQAIEREGQGLAAAVVQRAGALLKGGDPLSAPAVSLVRTALEVARQIGRRDASEKDNENKSLADMSLRDLGASMADQAEALATLRALLGRDAPRQEGKRGPMPRQVIDV